MEEYSYTSTHPPGPHQACDAITLHFYLSLKTKNNKLNTISNLWKSKKVILSENENNLIIKEEIHLKNAN